MPVPEPDVLQGGLVLRRFDGLDGRFRRELALRDAGQIIGLAGQLNIVGDIWALANQFIRFHDEAGDVPGNSLKREITECGGHDGSNKPTRPRH
jgi:hypothetical protein